MTFRTATIIYHLSYMAVCIPLSIWFYESLNSIFVLMIIILFCLVLFSYIHTVFYQYTKIIFIDKKIIFKKILGFKKEYEFDSLVKYSCGLKVTAFFFKNGDVVAVLNPIFKYWKLVKYINELKADRNN